MCHRNNRSFLKIRSDNTSVTWIFHENPDQVIWHRANNSRSINPRTYYCSEETCRCAGEHCDTFPLKVLSSGTGSYINTNRARDTSSDLPPILGCQIGDTVEVEADADKSVLRVYEMVITAKQGSHCIFRMILFWYIEKFCILHYLPWLRPISQ